MKHKLLSEVSHIGYVLTLNKLMNKIMSSNNINKFVNNQYTYVHIQYMNVLIKGI